MNKFFHPDTWWNAIEPRLGDRRLPIALFALALAGALGVAIACEIGIRSFNTDWSEAFGYTVQRKRTWQPFYALWLGFTVASIAQGVVAAAMATVYSRPRQWLPGVAVAIIGSVPMYVAGFALVLLPGILVFAIGFLISCGWWTSGNRRLLGIKDSDSPEHVAVSLAISGVLILLVSASVPL